MYFQSFLLFYDWLFLIIAFGVALYLRATRYRNYWRDQNVVHEKFSLFFGQQMKQLFKPFYLVDRELYKKHGRLFGSFEDGKPVLFVAEPDLLKLILVRDAALTHKKVAQFDDPILGNLMVNVDPKQWRKLRSATSPAFTTGKLRKMQAIIDGCAAVTSERLKRAAAASEDIDLKGFYGLYTLDAVASCSFGAKLSKGSAEETSFITSAKNAFFAEVTPLVVLKAFLQKLSKTFHENLFNEKAFEFYKNATINIIQKREEGKVRHEDFLQMMMNAKEVSKENAASGEENPENESSTMKPQDVKNLTEEEALAQCVFFFLAGQDTASTTASFATYQLAINPHIQERLRAEVDECFRKHGSSPSYDEVSKLSYLDGIVQETLRVMTPTPRIERSVAEDYIVGDTGIKVPRGCNILIPIQQMHNDPEFFPDPEVFNPERFNEENIKSIRPYTYLPFGAGPRNCLGSRFAIQIVKTCLLHAVHNVQFVKCSKTKDPVEYKTGFGILQPKELIVGVRQRDR
ncbi:cytochrome P450 3A24-like [Dermacentor andersoni]|uniref:cytochrome P450 3A24-like n=1 Tax=Dermacentor andersoni TaxID=34620 RepID=UPI002155E5B3|nr:cytochrome P450 3A24-like [Dermacentor andersoni]